MNKKMDICICMYILVFVSQNAGIKKNQSTAVCACDPRVNLFLLARLGANPIPIQRRAVLGGRGEGCFHFGYVCFFFFIPVTYVENLSACMEGTKVMMHFKLMLGPICAPRV